MPPLTSLEGKRVGFTGGMLTVTRDQAKQLAIENAATPTSGGKANDVLVVGTKRWPLRKPHGVAEPGRQSKKLQQALRRRFAGGGIEIISEYAFCQLVCLPPLRADRMSRAELARRWHQPESRVARLEELGLIQRGADGKFAWHDLSTVKQISQLIGDGISFRRISRDLSRLRAVLPGSATGIAQATFLGDPKLGAVLRQGGLDMLAGTGQFLLSFFDTPSNPVPIARGASWRDLVRAGNALYDASELDGASRLYECALESSDEPTEVMYNLACVREDQGRRSDAAVVLEKLLERSPRHSAARYRLASLLRALGQSKEAAARLVGGLAIDPYCADFHHLLALCLEDEGHIAEALVHWEQYARLDPMSRWGFEAARRAQQLRAALAGAWAGTSRLAIGSSTRMGNRT